MRGVLSVAALCTCFAVACGGSGGGPGPGASVTPTATPSGERLSSTGLYGDISTKQVSAGVRAFTPQYPLWADGGGKKRWILIPAGTTIDTSDLDRWVFPVGTRIWKEFEYQGRRVETRLIEKVAAGAAPSSWSYKSYQWLADESDAVLASSDGVLDAAPTGFGATHDIPSQAQCLACHSRGGDAPLGFDALQLSDDVDPLQPADDVRAPGDLTLDALVAQGLVTRAPARAPRIEASSALGRWSMGFLHVNCGNCHNPQGIASTVGMALRHETSAQSELDEPAYRTTVNRPTRVYVGKPFRIKGGSPDQSAILFRAASRAINDQMPPLATKVVDEEATDRLRQWIETLPGP